MKKLRLITLSEYRVPKDGPGLMSEEGAAVVMPKLRIALVDGTLFTDRDVGRRNVLKVGAQAWDIGNRGIEDVGIIDEHECVQVDASDPFVAECQRQLERKYAPIRSVIKAESGDLPDQAQRLLDQILHDYKDSSLSEKTVPNPPVRGPYGDCTFTIIHDTPKKQRPFHLIGEREDALRDLIQEFIDRGWVEPSNSKWCSPAFTVPKKNGEYRLVIDYRWLNECLETDAYPLPLIEDVLELQGSKRSGLCWT